MKRINLIMSSILLFCLLLLCFILRFDSSTVPAMDISADKFQNASTREWQDIAFMYIVKRNKVINDALDGKYKSIKKCIADLKSIESSPLIDGDTALLECIIKYPMQFPGKSEGTRLEYTEIQKLTQDEVTLLSKMYYLRDGVPWRYNYKIGFRNINGEWKLSCIENGD